MHSCQYCGALLPETKRRHARYCGGRCRVAAHRARDPGLPSHLGIKMLHLCLEEAKREGKAAKGRRLVHGPLAGEAREYFWEIARYGVEMPVNAAHGEAHGNPAARALLLRFLQELVRRRAPEGPVLSGGDRGPVSDPTTEEHP